MSTPMRSSPAIPRLAVVGLAVGCVLAAVALPAAAADSAPAAEAAPVPGAAAADAIEPAAVPGREIVSAVTANDSTSPKFLTVTCPSGKQLTGTGYVINGATGEVVVDDLRPNGGVSAAPTSVFAGAYEVDPYAGNWNIRVYAVCVSPLDGLVRVSATSASDSNDYHSARATCPSGKQLVGTGYELNGAAGEAVLDDFIPNGSATVAPTSVLAGAYEADPPYAGIWSVTAYAVCAYPLDGLSRASTTGPSNSDDYHSVIATCPSGKVLTGTGFAMTGVTGEGVVDDFQPRAASAWAGAYEEDPVAGNWYLATYAICAVA